MMKRIERRAGGGGEKKVGKKKDEEEKKRSFVKIATWIGVKRNQE